MRQNIKMKKEIHPKNYRNVVFKDMSNGTAHPFYTGKNVLVDTAGRIDKFNKRFGKKSKVAEAAPAAEAETAE